MLVKSVSLLLYFALFIGWFLTFSDDILYTVIQSKAKSQVQARIKTKEKNKDGSDKQSFNEYVADMMAIVEGKRKQDALIRFYEYSILLCITFFLVAYVLLTSKVAPLTALIGLILPFCYYRSKLQGIRNEASQEGEILATELLNNYKVCYYNILEAIRNTAETISPDEAPHSKRMLVQLAHSFNTISSKDDVSKAVDRFKFGIDTTWAALLATNIELAHTEGVMITSSMEDLIASIIKARKTKEELKRQGSEGRRMLKILVPLIYIITAVSGTSVFGMTLGQFFHQQFKTDMGSTWFVVVFVTYIGSLLFSYFVGKDKMDI